MAGTDIRVHGLAAAVRELERLGVDLQDLKAAFAQIATEAVPTYRRFTPRRSGRLAGNYRSSKTKNRVQLIVGSAAVPYAKPINYGWPARNIRAADFVAKGDQVTTPKAIEAIEAEINRLIQTM